MPGLMDSINAGLQAGMTSPLFNLGAGLLQAGTTPMGSVGTSLMGAANNTLAQQQAQQNLYVQRVNMQMMVQSMPAVMQFLHASGGLMGPSPGDPQSGQPNQPQPNQVAPGAGGLLGGSPQPSGGGLLSAPGTPQQPAQQIPQQAPQQATGLQGGGIDDPNQAMRASLGMSALGAFNPIAASVAPYLSKYAEYQQANNPQLITQREVAKSPLTVAQAQYQQALTSSDPDAAQRAFTNLRQVAGQQHIGSMSGILTTQLQNGSWLTVNPSTGLQTVINPKLLENAPAGAEWLPGEVNAIRTRAAAEAGGTQSGEAPYELVPMVGPDKQTYMVPKSALLQGGGAPPRGGASGAGGPTASVPGAPAGAVGVSGQSPEQSSQQSAAGRGAGEELTELNKQADSARQANYTLDQLRELGKGASLGPAAPAREWFEQVATPLAQAFGMSPPKELATYEQINKFGNTLAFNAARAMGSREAAQIVQLQVQSNPNKALVPDAYNGLIDSMSAMNNYVLAKNGAIQGAASGGQITARQATANWETGIDPKVWDLAISPAMASRFAGQIGAAKITKALPFMASDDAVTTMRNVSPTLQQQVLRGLPTEAKQEILTALQAGQQPASTHRSGPIIRSPGAY